MVLLVIAAASLGLAAFLFGEVATLPARQREGSLRRAATYGARVRRAVGRPEAERTGGFRERALVPLSTSLARFVLRLSPHATIDSINAKLLGAGLGRSVSPTTYLAAKAMLAIGGFFAGIALTAVAGKSAGGSLLFTILCAFTGFFLPDV